ncbi:homoprotocatechuate degradation operon regulator HpaR, partial [Escherichia coli]|nr:homoprotocatechuate degradation operon regulator HpaR [Escherichia coli]
SDQRKLYISLTPDGKLLYEKARLQVEEGYQAIEQAFSSEKMTQLTLLLDELIALGNLSSATENDE